MKIFVCGLMMTLLCLTTAISDASAQQTIFNVPSTDVLDKGWVYVEYGSNFKINSQDDFRRFSTYVPRGVVGIGNNIEIGVNYLGKIRPGPETPTLSPTIKWKFYQNEKKGIAAVFGNNLFIPLRNRQYNIGNYAYSAMSKTFKSGTRVTAGGFHFTKNVVAPDAARAGGQFGFEQPVNKYFGVAADWYTGKHAAGYFTPGINFKPHKRVIGYAGYSIGNADAARGNHFVYGAVGIYVFTK